MLSWIQNYLAHSMRHQPRITSDHHLILLSMDTAVSCYPLFRFKKFWLAYPHAEDIVREVWNTPVRGDARYRVTRILELLKRLLWYEIELR